MCNFNNRYGAHDKLENELMDEIRPYTTRRHLPDRWVSFSGELCPFDLKASSPFMEDNSHDEYFRLLEAGFYVWIIYRDGNGKLRADWLSRLKLTGPCAPSPKSRNGDPYYSIRGGRPYKDFLKAAAKEVEAMRKAQR